MPWNKLYRTVDMPPPFRPPDWRALQTWWMRHQNRYKYREGGPDDTFNRTVRAAYYACISFIDYHLGRILRILEATGQSRDTLVVFTSDHGELLGDYGSWGKRSFLDPAARVPLVLRWPGVLPGGTTVTEPVSLLDIMPTALAAAGLVPAEHDLDGLDLRRTAGRGERRVILGQLSHGQRGTYLATDGHCKYIYSAPDQREYLFDLDAEPREAVNRAADAAYANRLAALRATLLGRFDSHRFFGTSYRAAGWLCLGETTGRGKWDRHTRRTHRLPERFIFVRPLRPDYRAILRAPLPPTPHLSPEPLRPPLALPRSSVNTYVPRTRRSGPPPEPRAGCQPAARPRRPCAPTECPRR